MGIVAQERLSQDISAIQRGAKTRDIGILSRIAQVKKQRRQQYGSMLSTTGSAIIQGALAYKQYQSFGGGK